MMATDFDIQPVSDVEAFKIKFRPHAEKVAKDLGVSPNVVLAQAALETGWGKKAPGNNLFGIKGRGQQLATKEFEGGQFRDVQASFRTYNSPGESFEDYNAFLRRNPRYRKALANPDRFPEELQAAGYATDPAYAQKIRDIEQRLLNDEMEVIGTAGSAAEPDGIKVIGTAREVFGTDGIEVIGTAGELRQEGPVGTVEREVGEFLTAVKKGFKRFVPQLQLAAGGLQTLAAEAPGGKLRQIEVPEGLREEHEERSRFVGRMQELTEGRSRVSPAEARAAMAEEGPAPEVRSERDSPEVRQQALQEGQARMLEASRRLAELDVTTGVGDEFAADVAAGIAQVGATVVLGAVGGPAAAIAGLFGFASGLNYADDRVVKNIEPAQALLNSTAKSSFESLTEMVPLKFLLSKPGERVLGDILKAGGAEGLQEGVAAFFNELVDAGLVNKEMSLGEVAEKIEKEWPQIVKNVGYEALVGGTAGGVVRGGVTAAQRLAEPSEQRAERLVAREEEKRRKEEQKALRQAEREARPVGKYMPIPSQVLEEMEKVRGAEDVLKASAAGMVESAGEGEVSAVPQMADPNNPRIDQAIGSLPDVGPQIPAVPDNPRFQEWFKGSKVVAPEGTPEVVYHLGTTEPGGEPLQIFFPGGEKGKENFPLSGTITESKVGEPGLRSGPGIWFGPKEALSIGPQPFNKPGGTRENIQTTQLAATYPVYLALKNPLRITSHAQRQELKQSVKPFPERRQGIPFTPDFPYRFDGAQRRQLIREGYDGIILEIPGEPKEYIAFYPQQIKSATGNRGTFDPSDPRIDQAGDVIDTPSPPSVQGGPVPGRQVFSVPIGFNSQNPKLDEAKRNEIRENTLTRMKRTVPEDPARASNAMQRQRNLIQIASGSPGVTVDARKPGGWPRIPLGMAERIGDVVQVLQRRFDPKGRYVVGFGMTGLDFFGQFHLQTAKGHEFSIAPEGVNPVHVLEFNTDTMLWEYTEGRLDDVNLFQTISHEFGHALIKRELLNLNTRHRAALFNAYEQSLRRRLKMTLEDFVQEYYPPGDARKAKALLEAQQTGGLMVKDMSQRWMDYHLSFEEWAAQQMSGQAQVREGVRKGVGDFLPKLEKQLRDVYAYAVENFRGIEPTFEAWVSNLGARNKLEELQQGLMAVPPEVAKPRLADVTRDKIRAGRINWQKKVQKVTGNIPGFPKRFKKEHDKWNWHMRVWNTMLQISERNPHIQPLKTYTQLIRDWSAYKSKWLARTTERITGSRDTVGWNRLHGSQQDRLAEFLLDVTVQSDKLGRRLTPEELATINLNRKVPLNNVELELYGKIDQDFQDAMEELRNVLKEDRAKIIKDDIPGLQAALAEVDTEIDRLKNRNYFPLTRFGQEFVTIKATKEDVKFEGETYKIGEVVYFETFEGVLAGRQREKAIKEWKRKLNSREFFVTGGRLEEEGFRFQGLPPTLLDAIQNKLGLDTEQQKLLGELLVQLAPGTAYVKHLQRRKGTPGFSKDALRAYAEYMIRFANHIGRIRYYRDLNEAVSQTKKSAAGLSARGDASNASKRMRIGDWMQRHYEYVMSPGNEWSGLRSFGFNWWLGGVLSSAYLNATQTITMTYPYLSDLYGEGKTTAELGRTMADISKGLVNPKVYEPEVDWFLQKGVEDGFLDESFATEVGGLAAGSAIERLLPRTKIGRGAKAVTHWSALPFQTMEKINRRIAGVTALRLARNQTGKRWKDMTEQERMDVYQQARWAVERTQGEYARWNRPEFMRGPVKSNVFLFYMFVQHAMHFYRRAPGHGKALMIMLAGAGLTGLPGSEDAKDLVEAMLVKYPGLANQMGLKGPVNLEVEFRKVVEEMGGGATLADLALNGVSSKYGLGPMHFLSAAGVPVPEIDMSQSLGLGNVIPAVPQLLRDAAFGVDKDTAVKRAAQDAVGASFGIPLQLLDATFSTDPDAWKRYEKFLPRALKNVSEAVRWAKDGEVQDYRGDKILDIDPYDPMQAAEIVLKAGAFRPTRVSKEQEIRWTQREQAMFYDTWRSILLRQWVHAREVGSDEMQKEVEAEIRRFNNSVPSGVLRIGGLTKMRVLKNSRVDERLKEKGIAPDRRHRRIYDEVRDLYEEKE